mmetsp:Transcript_50984/g.118468  ORF Transcript_50984/g.118468 Transcript_50984/m.118468 type:complete len:260 (+) Transcript_50984:942-1721(+)
MAVSVDAQLELEHLSAVAFAVHLDDGLFHAESQVQHLVSVAFLLVSAPCDSNVGAADDFSAHGPVLLTQHFEHLKEACEVGFALTLIHHGHEKHASVDGRDNRGKLECRLHLHLRYWYGCRDCTLVTVRGHQELHLEHGIPPTQVRLHTRNELLPVERLVDPVVATKLQSLDDRTRLVLGGDHDDGELLRRRLLALLLQHVEAIDPGHHQVQEDQIRHDGILFFHVLQALCPAHADDDGESARLQHRPHHLLVHVVIVH